MSPKLQSLLTSLHLLERKRNSPNLRYTLCYPSLDDSSRSIYTNKFRILSQDFKDFGCHYFHHLDKWVYFIASKTDLESHESKGDRIVIAVGSLDFNPERYETICQELTRCYLESDISTFQPADILSRFLSFVTMGYLSLDVKFLDVEDSFKLKKLSIRSITESFGMETILIYTALLLKRRIIVYHHDVTNLLEFVLNLPTLVEHRDSWNFLYPIVENIQAELSAFKDSQFHVIGCTDGNISNRTDLYDVFVNVPASEVTVASHARDSMTMTKAHKDIALFIVQLSENKGFTDYDMMKEISRKTKELIQNLRMMGTEVNGRVTLSLGELKGKNLSATQESFLCNLARAEDFAVVE